MLDGLQERSSMEQRGYFLDNSNPTSFVSSYHRLLGRLQQVTYQFQNWQKIWKRPVKHEKHRTSQHSGITRNSVLRAGLKFDVFRWIINRWVHKNVFTRSSQDFWKQSFTRTIYENDHKEQFCRYPNANFENGRDSKKGITKYFRESAIVSKVSYWLLKDVLYLHAVNFKKSGTC